MLLNQKREYSKDLTMKTIKITTTRIHINCILIIHKQTGSKKAININFQRHKSIHQTKGHQRIYKLYFVKQSSLNSSKKLTIFMRSSWKIKAKESISFNF